MKKILSVLLLTVVCSYMMSCTKVIEEIEPVVTTTVTETTIEEVTETEPSQPANDLNTMMEQVYDGVETPMTFVTAINGDNAGYYIGISDPAVFTEALSSDAMINVVPHSVCLVKVAEGQDVEEVKAMIEENANPNKWICAFAETVIVDNVGDVIILIMSDTDTANALHNNFMGLV